MANAEQYLWSLVGQIEPTTAQKSGAARSQNYLREVLQTGRMLNRIRDVYLSGSYSRDTAIRPLDDVDIVVEINHEHWPKGFLSDYPPPVAVLDSFSSAIRYRYPVSSVFGQRRSIRLELNHLDIDVVPAIPLAGGDFILVPDRTAERWIKSGPKIHAKVATQVNNRWEGRFKPLVKLLKLWNANLPSTVQVKSFAVETMAVHYFSRYKLNSLEEGLSLFLDALASFSDGGLLQSHDPDVGFTLSWARSKLPDIAGTGSNLFERLDEERRRKLISSARVSRDRIMSARAARTEDSCWAYLRDAFRV
jgi:hypothetical protein